MVRSAPIILFLESHVRDISICSSSKGRESTQPAGQWMLLLGRSQSPAVRSRSLPHTVAPRVIANYRTWTEESRTIFSEGQKKKGGWKKYGVKSKSLPLLSTRGHAHPWLLACLVLLREQTAQKDRKSWLCQWPWTAHYPLQPLEENIETETCTQYSGFP